MYVHDQSQIKLTSFIYFFKYYIDFNFQREIFIYENHLYCAVVLVHFDLIQLYCCQRNIVTIPEDRFERVPSEQQGHYNLNEVMKRKCSFVGGLIQQKLQRMICL